MIYFSDHGATSPEEMAALISEYASWIPPQLKEALPKRKADFIRGRICAQKALHHAEPENFPSPSPKITPSVKLSTSDLTGAPVWPERFVGSITHCSGYAAAMIASSRDVKSIGIDAEAVMPHERASRLQSKIASDPYEQKILSTFSQDHRLPLESALTLIFSAKESVYKCFNPLIHEPMSFEDVILTRIDNQTSTFEMEIQRERSAIFARKGLIQGQFFIKSNKIFTSIILLKNDIPSFHLTSKLALSD